jgi:hypothetical protein
MSSGQREGKNLLTLSLTKTAIPTHWSNLSVIHACDQVLSMGNNKT